MRMLECNKGGYFSARKTFLMDMNIKQGILNVLGINTIDENTSA